MPVRFLCAACSQPLEVDDEWALRMVACPYCQKTVSVPAESTLFDLHQIPVAKPAFGEAPRSPSPPLSELSNPYAVAAVLLLGLMTVTSMIGWIILAPHVDELIAINQSFFEDGWQGVMKAQAEMLESYDGYPTWLAVAQLLELSGGLCWLGGLICAILAVRRRSRRGLAVTALVLSLILPVFLCCGGPVIVEAGARISRS